MRKKVLLTGGIAAAALLAAGWALAQPGPHGPGGFSPPFMQDEGRDGTDPAGMGPGGMHGSMGERMHGRMGPGMREHMGAGMHGPGMMGMGPGMMGMSHGDATASEHQDIRDLFFNHDRIKRTVTNLPDGIRTVTQSDDPRLAEVIKKHVAEMGKRIEEGRDPGLPIESPALHSLFRDKDKIKTTYDVTDKGVAVVQTSTDASVVKALQEHAAEVSELARRGMPAAHEAMMRNGGMMGHGMHGATGGPRH